MAISHKDLKADLIELFTAESDKKVPQSESIANISHGIAEAVARQIEQGIKTATVKHVLTSETGEEITGEITINTSIEYEELAD